MSRMESTVANPETHNMKEHSIAPGVPRDQSIENDPKSINRAHKVAEMPEYSGKTLADGAASGQGRMPGTGKQVGQGKGGLDHEPERVKKGGKPTGYEV